ncbi:TRAP transporter small permease [Planococcus lenghuensis]|uniref:C4-dicarboxylate ABC transporter permease n=1 Tax=Planococcus lenghuensis TaxID=2213202 RepID=A0A1Q2L2L4_9BACL|nr:TRAP transporter small permease [Planococcus lenghuensis]AQQ54698.1 C4-dicarboxylate ABC transporter permease [Planococcus lenghuensis]
MKILNHLEDLILFVAFLIMTIVAFTNVVSRNVANISLTFSEELTINLFVLLTFVGTAVGVREYAHLGFTLIFDRMNSGYRKGIVLFCTLMGLFLFGVLFWYGIQMVLFQLELGQTTPSLGWPQWILSLALPIGATLCIIRTVQVCIEEWKITGRSTSKGDEAI